LSGQRRREEALLREARRASYAVTSLIQPSRLSSST
jgi:hypothetical protein